MKKTLTLLGIALMFIGIIVIGLGLAAKGFSPGGDYTGDNDGVKTHSVYCKAAVEGKLKYGSNIKISQLECQVDEPLFMANTLSILTAVEDMSCRGYLLNDGEKVSTSSKTTFGDIGAGEKVWYKFGVSKVPEGEYTVKVTCESAVSPIDTATLEDSLIV